MRRKQYEQMRDSILGKSPRSSVPVDPAEKKYGTVGAVALDRTGNLAAGTSTGGTSRKMYGRVGDSPIIGAGVFADNASCAVSATGTGEFFIRNTVAVDICKRVEYLHESIAQAADAVIMKKLVAQHGDGGVIVVDRKGNITTPFNTAGMYRAYVGTDGVVHVEIFK
jgi:beta-aspartyl-peptidase (threonine type)